MLTHWQCRNGETRQALALTGAILTPALPEKRNTADRRT